MDSPKKLEGLVRSLNLIPYLRTHTAATPMEIARDLGSTHQQVMDDLSRLSLSGVGRGPGELIDLVASWTGITLIDDQGLNRPLRLTPTEANALLLTLESLETMPGLVDTKAVTSAAEKIRKVVAGSGVSDAVHPAEPGPAAAVAEAVAVKHKLELVYYSASSDTTSTRRVTPVNLFHRDSETYLRAVEDDVVKTFRLDRVRAATVLDAPAPPEVISRAGGFDARDPFGFSDAARARVEVRREATWLADYWEIDLEVSAPAREGWVSAEIPYGTVEWLIRFCLAQADRVVLRHPADVAEEVARRARLAAERLR
ncbi:hypothetical protein CAPI_05655 [Corynebacterium capitovis DSM 44611]|uniref:helix-turn-helix transcriptional regulator n=1 Tax=Corynebacterium capitovis TaxID=131081 RepID=UPI00036CB254|nr:WYL domain-containing protein [Corynebacterium capitovis]WKD57681.1 hypothetical protein CAPI_05655 [Corynebacterium capitovis DSM 44611]